MRIDDTIILALNDTLARFYDVRVTTVSFRRASRRVSRIVRSIPRLLAAAQPNEESVDYSAVREHDRTPSCRDCVRRE